MNKFTTRVELQGAAGEDYELLHYAMKNEGFTCLIQTGDGRSYRLPTAEYSVEANLTQSAVLENAKRAAEKTGKNYSVLVTESVGRMWVGLQETVAHR